MQLTYQKLNENQMWNKKKKQINCNIATIIIEQTLRKIDSIRVKIRYWRGKGQSQQVDCDM